MRFSTEREQFFFRALTIACHAVDPKNPILMRNLALIQAAKEMGRDFPKVSPRRVKK